jgi:16S rRNA (cytosine967-C5)-methyltransferase
MLYLSRVPDFAVVHDAVEMAKQSGQPAAAALVNAVLRNIQRAGKAKPAGDAKELSPTLLPDYIRRRWQQRWGEKTARAFIERSATQPLFCLRVNLRKTTRQELMRHLEQAQLAPREGALAETIILDRPRGPVVNFPGYAEGWWYVQDQAAQWIPHLVDPQPGEVILDLCAAPGGKTTHLAEMLGPKGRIWAYDITAAKRTRIRENCVRLGLGNVQVAEAVSELPRACDRVLVDAPCSGLGTLNRHLEAGRRVSRSQTQRLQTQQLALLAQAGALVRPGGWLIYATCTTEPEENEGVIAQFLSSRRDFFKVPVAGPFAARDGFFRTFPQALEYDGMFAARLRKKDG